MLLDDIVHKELLKMGKLDIAYDQKGIDKLVDMYLLEIDNMEYKDAELDLPVEKWLREVVNFVE